MIQPVVPGRSGRPPTGFGHYLRDLVYGASDGVVTTLAIVAAVEGAELPTRVAVILGLANLVGDGFSMGASNYLGLKSELEQQGQSVAAEKPFRHGLATAAAFVVVGAVPLFALFTPFESKLGWAIGSSAVALGLAGATRGRFVNRSPLICALEMVAIGAASSGAAFAVGWLARSLGPA